MMNTHPLVALVACLALVLLACCRGVEPRIRLNTIRTVILKEGQVLPVNRSSWEPNLDLAFYQCMSDLECSEGSYCHVTTRGHTHSNCLTCRRRKRRCHRVGMCCPGNHCSHGTCVPDADSLVSWKILDSDGKMNPRSPRRSWRKNRRMKGKGYSGNGQVGDPCLRSRDCSEGLCCARHFWARICKPVLQEGQVCTRHRRKGNTGLELFQRCSCGDGLSCRTLSQSSTQHSAPSSSLLAVATKSKFAAPSLSRHSSPHMPTQSAPNMSPLSSSTKSSSAVGKMRLHVCQKN